MALRRQVKNFVKNYSEAEVKVREATSNDPWGPSSSLMLDISDLTFNTVSLSEIMNMLWQRLNDHGKNWRHVYKSLTLMDYLIKNGSKKVIQLCREGFFNIQTLKDFHHIDEAGKDQGYYVREKSKQIITLLMDSQLLHKEREVACRTRRRTSYSMTFPKRLPGAGHSPTHLAGPALASDASASENKRTLLKVSRLHLTKSTSKTELRPEQSYCIHMPSRSAVSQETLPLKINAWKSAEDLMVFYDEEPKQLLPPAPPMMPPTSLVTEECEEGYSLWDSDAMPAPLEKSPSLHTNLSSGKRLDSFGIDQLDLSNLALENNMQQSLECHSPQKNCDALGTVQGLWPSGREEAVNTNIRVSKSDPFFHRSQAFFHRSQASVETLYVSPSFKTFEPLKESLISKEYPEPTQNLSKQFSETNMTPLPNRSSNSVKMDGMDLNPFARHDSTISEGTSSSFSTFSISSPDLATPENILYPLGLPSGGPSLRPSSHRPSSSSVLFKEMPVRVNHPFAPCPTSSDEDESDNINLLDILPDNSNSADTRTLNAMRGNWITFPIQDMQCLISASDPTSLASKQLPEAPGTDTPIMAELVEIKNDIRRLHGDLTAVVQELRIVNSHLESIEAENSQQGTRQVSKPLLPTDGPSQF
ncbi:ENTH domain-containing protein 1 [Trichosurus vulpecula]|uniref:ENTH domain-containing protein 1 n=1 Tax=Trichosurus vulpecula TaxID=9337 RepID=UPI00186B25F4|nr:ENTH domain-containing protein 1 [Trichosurus vulpecula]